MAQEGMTVTFYDREFNQAIDDLAADSRRNDVSVLTLQAIHFLRAIVFRTTLAEKKGLGRNAKGQFTGGYKNRGRARAGWWPSWLGLGAFSVPQGTNAKVLAEAEGEFRDGRQKRSFPFVELINKVPYILKLDSKHDIVRAAASDRFNDMQRAITERYRRTMQKRSG